VKTRKVAAEELKKIATLSEETATT